MGSCRAALALSLVALAAAGPARAQDLTPRKQALLLLRVLAYDRNLRHRAGSAVRVAVVFRPGDRESEERRDAMVASFEEVAREVVAAGLPIQVTAIPFLGSADLEARLAASHATAAYVCQRLLPAVPEIARATRRRGVLSAAASRELVAAGLAVGVVNRGPRAGVMVNLRAAKEEGASLDAALLAIAEVIP